MAWYRESPECPDKVVGFPIFGPRTDLLGHVINIRVCDWLELNIMTK